MRRLTAEDYAVDAVTMAKALVGAWLCRRLEDGSVVRRRITETEAYCGEEDTACHAHKGRTARTDVMYSPGGCAYIYLCYGMHEMLNVVTGPEGRPEAVLIRGVEGAEGPGRLTKFLKIDRSLNREDLVHSNRLWLESDCSRVKFTAAPRIGIAYASKRDQNRKWRFTLKQCANSFALLQTGVRHICRGFWYNVRMTTTTRRLFCGGAACAALSAFGNALPKGTRTMNEITLSPLPYADNALEPTISSRTISFHYGKHHAGYVTTLKGLVAGTKYEGLSLGEIVVVSRAAGDSAIFNNAAQAWNHDFYWNSLAPEGKGGEPSSALKAAVDAAFGSLDACRTALADAAVKRFGSGWAWLVAKGRKLSVESTANADTPFGLAGVKPLLVVDVWEHAYYLDWQNQRAAYAKAVVEKHLDWSAASRRFAAD